MTQAPQHCRGRHRCPASKHSLLFPLEPIHKDWDPLSGTAPPSGFSQGGSCPNGLNIHSGRQADGRMEQACAESQRPGLKIQLLFRLALWPQHFATPLRASVSTSVKWESYHHKAVGGLNKSLVGQYPAQGLVHQ